MYKDRKWIQSAIKRPGAFTRKAQAAGVSVAAMASRVVANPDRYSKLTVRQARLAKTLRRLK